MSTMLGYPSNFNYDIAPLLKFFELSLNNIGDPFIESSYKVHTRPFELEVIDFFSDLYNLPHDQTWGYVTSGGTEGNMYGLYVARELYPEGILYFSEDSHYSITKIARMLRMKHIMIGSSENGEIDYLDLNEMIKVNRAFPVIINLNIGTTMKGAIDDVHMIVEILKKNKIQNYYLHCDCALGGLFLPFLDSNKKFDFDQPIGSLAISGHKFIGSPFPCGVVVVRKKHVQRIARNIEYIGSLDTTVLGSRSGHAPLILWHAIKTRGKEGFKAEVQTCLQNAQYLYTKLKALKYPVYINDDANMVVLKKPSSTLLNKWQLAVQGDFAHIVVMQHVTKRKIDLFLDDLKVELCEE